MDSLDEDFELVWIVKDLRDDLDIKQYKAYHPPAILKILRASYIISTHGNLRRVRVPSQVFVNVWHDMPLKTIGYAENRNVLPFNFDDENYYLIATSIIMMNALAACFNQDPRRIFVTGQNFKKFLEEIKKSIKDPDYYSQERRTINNLINYHKDDKSTERIYKLVFKD